VNLDRGAARFGVSPILGVGHTLLDDHPLPAPLGPARPLYVYLKPVADFGVGGVRAISIPELVGHIIANRGRPALELRGLEVALGLSLSYNPVVAAQTLFVPLRFVDTISQLLHAGTPIADLTRALDHGGLQDVTWQWNPELAAVAAVPIDLSRPSRLPHGAAPAPPAGHDWRPRWEHGEVTGYVDGGLVALPVRSPTTGTVIGWEIT
jgi:hypothetical protein